MASSVSAASIESTKAGDDLLTADLGKNDYDWLLTPPGTPPINPVDHNSTGITDDLLSPAALPNLVRSLAAIKTSRLLGSKSDPVKKDPPSGALFSTRLDPSLRNGRNNLYRSPGAAANAFNSLTNSANKRTPLAPSSRPSSRPSSPMKRNPVGPTTTSSRPTTPTSRSKPASTPVSSRPTTPTGRSKPDSAFRNGNTSSSVSSSSYSRPGASSSRPTTPVRRSSITPPASSQPPSAAASRPSSVSKGRPMPSRSNPSSRSGSPTAAKANNTWQQLSAIPGFSLEPPPNLRTSMSARPTSNSRGSSVGSLSRPGTPSAGSTSSMSRVGSMPVSSDPSARRNPSPARGRSGIPSLSTADRTSSVMSRNSSKVERSPTDIAARSTKTVEKMIQARRPIASAVSPEMTRSISQARSLVKPGSPMASRTLPRKTFDLNMLNRDIRHNTSNGLNSLVSNIPTSSIYSIRATGLHDYSNNSPTMAINSASPDYHMSIARDLEGSSDLGEEFMNEYGNKASPVSQAESFSYLVKDTRVNNWLGSPESRDGNLEMVRTPDPPPALMSTPVATTTSDEKLTSSSESPIVCRHGGVAATCDLCMVKLRLQKLNEKCRASLGASLQASLSNGVQSIGK